MSTMTTGKRFAAAGMTSALALALLVACGGGGGDSGSPATSTIRIDVTEDAHTDGTSLSAAGDRHIVGDDAGGNDFVGLLRFPLASIPAGSNVVGAYLNISFLDKHGTPAGNQLNNLGAMQFIRLDGATALATGDYSATGLALDPANNLIVDLPNTRPRIGLLQVVLSALAAGDTHLKLRLQYQIDTNSNGVADNMEFASIDHASALRAELEVITQP